MVGSNNGKIFNSPIEECIKRVTSSLTSSIKPFKQLPLDYILIAFHTSCIISYPIKLIVSPNFLINLLNQFTYRHYSIYSNIYHSQGYQTLHPLVQAGPLYKTPM